MQYFTFWVSYKFSLYCVTWIRIWGHSCITSTQFPFLAPLLFRPAPLLPPPCHPNYALKITSNYHFYSYLLSLWNDVIYGWVLSCAQKGGPYLFSFCSHIVLGNTILWWNYIQHVFIVICSSEEILTRFAFTIYRHKSFSCRINGGVCGGRGHLQMISDFLVYFDLPTHVNFLTRPSLRIRVVVIFR